MDDIIDKMYPNKDFYNSMWVLWKWQDNSKKKKRFPTITHKENI